MLFCLLTNSFDYLSVSSSKLISLISNWIYHLNSFQTCLHKRNHLHFFFHYSLNSSFYQQFFSLCRQIPNCLSIFPSICVNNSPHYFFHRSFCFLSIYQPVRCVHVSMSEYVNIKIILHTCDWYYLSALKQFSLFNVCEHIYTHAHQTITLGTLYLS